VTLDPFHPEPAAPDIYQSVLGIPPGHRPPNHYELIGAPLFEGNIKSLASIADSQIARLRKFRPDPKTMQQLYYELCLARVVLTDPATKAGYDQQLQGEHEHSVEPAASENEQPAFHDDIASHDEPFASIVTGTRRRRRGPGPMLAAVGVNLVIAMVALAYFRPLDEVVEAPPAPKPAPAPVVARRLPPPRPVAQSVRQVEQPQAPPAATTTTEVVSTEPAAEPQETPDNIPQLLVVPSLGELEPLLARLKEVYGDQLDSIRKAVTTVRPKKLSGLATEILAQAEKESDSQWQFAALSLAQMVAIESRDLPLSLQVLDNVCGRFDVDEMGQRWAVLESICTKSHDPGRWEILRSFAQHSIAYERYDLALGAMNMLKAGQPNRLSAFERVELDLLKNFFAASNTLQTEPLSRAALHDIGLFYVFIADQPDDGFQALAAGRNPALSELASMELAASGVKTLMRYLPPGAVEVIEPLRRDHYLRLARGWREYGQNAQEKSIYRLKAYDRARTYFRAHPSLKGADRIEAEKFLTAWQEDRDRIHRALHALPKSTIAADKNDLKSEQIQLAKMLLTRRSQERAMLRHGFGHGTQQPEAAQQKNQGKATGQTSAANQASAATGQANAPTAADQASTATKQASEAHATHPTGASYSMSHATMSPHELVIARAMQRAESRPMLMEWERMDQPVFVIGHPLEHLNHPLGHSYGHPAGSEHHGATMPHHH
jgi:hypothetical protein